MSLILEGLANDTLHDASLYSKKHKSLSTFIKDAIDLDDNVDEYNDGGPMGMGEVGSQQSFKPRVFMRAIQPLVTSQRVKNWLMR